MSPPTPTTAATAHTPISDPTQHTHTPPPPTTRHTTPLLHTTTTKNGYAHLPLPILPPTDVRLLSHNINTLHTSTQAELGATFDLYQDFSPTILGIQECNKNWSINDKTVAPLRDVIH